jgi:hypothetical protein
VCPTLIRERSAKVGRPGRSVAASASALGAEDRRFESCRPDTVIQSMALAPEDHRGNAGVAQWQSPSLPSWPCEFDSRHPLQWHKPLSGAVSRPVIERGEAALDRGRLVIWGRSCGVQAQGLPWSGRHSSSDFGLSWVITSLIRGPHPGHNRARRSEMRPAGSQSDCRGHCRPGRPIPAQV